MSTFIILVWIVASPWALFYVLRPSTKWALFNTRARAFGSFLAIFFGLPIFATALIPVPSAEVKPKAMGEATRPLATALTPAEIEAQTNANAEAQLAQQKAEAEERKAEIEREARRSPEDFLELTRTRAWKDGFDMVVMISGTIRSKAPIPIKDPKIRCYLFAESGTSVGSVAQSILKIVPPGKSISFDETNMGFADSRWQRYSCEITSAVALE